MSFEIKDYKLKEVKPRLVYEEKNINNLNAKEYVETIVSDKYSNKLLLTLSNILSKLKNTTLTPDLGERVDIIISEKTSKERKDYYENNIGTYNAVPLTSRTSFSSKKIWIPIDLLDYEMEIAKNIDYKNDIKLSNAVTNKIIDSIEIQGVNKDIKDDLIVSLNLGHEMGHYYFSKIFEEFNFTKCIYNKKITYNDSYKIWASLFTETFADKFAIQISDFVNGFNLSQKVMQSLREKDRDEFLFFIKNKHEITPHDRMFSDDKIGLSVIKMFQDALNETNNIFTKGGMEGFLKESKLQDEINEIEKTLMLCCEKNIKNDKVVVLEKIEKMRAKNSSETKLKDFKNSY